MKRFVLSRWRSVILFIAFLGQTAGLILMTERAAMAYVDPGSGLLAFQIVGASIVGVFYLLRQRLREWFSRFRTAPQFTPPAPDHTPRDSAGARSAHHRR
jgi:hypothetical protein